MKCVPPQADIRFASTLTIIFEIWIVWFLLDKLVGGGLDNYELRIKNHESVEPASAYFFRVTNCLDSCLNRLERELRD